jgi:CspA family cold shock protein
MQNGTIARLLIDKGFGFIRDEGGTEHFFHRSSVRGAVFELLREGQRVEFTTEESPKGPRVRRPFFFCGMRTIPGCQRPGTMRAPGPA